MAVTGSCHCGAVRIEVPRAPAWVASCNCSICRRTGALMAYYRPDEVRVEGETAAYLTGDNFLEHKPELEGSPLVQKHEDLAGQLLWITIAFGVISLAAGWLSTRTGALRVVLDALLAVGAVLVLVWVVRTGDAGAQSVWSQ